MRLLRIIIQAILYLGILGGGIYLIATSHLVGRIENRLSPCSSPLRYSLGTFDARFGITQKEFLTDAARAEKIWEDGAGKELFTYDPAGPLVINLIYDARQESTNRLARLGIVINNDQTTYNSLTTKYETLKAEYGAEKQKLDSLVADYKTKEAAYNSQVSAWNSRGGAPRTVFAQLQATGTGLKTEFDQINTMQSNVNELVTNINTLASASNEVAKVLNLNAATYNTIGASQGATFEEGQYVSDISGAHIDLYQFGNETKLIRVLAHEFGHALGLSHVSSSKAIMYYLNEAGNEKLTAEDLAELKNKCGLK